MVILWKHTGDIGERERFFEQNFQRYIHPSLCGALLRHRTRHNFYFVFRSEGRQPYLVCPRTDLDVAL